MRPATGTATSWLEARSSGLEPGGHVDQRAVAGGVAQLVVDRLEVVEVDEQQGQRDAGPGAAAQGGRQPLPEQGPVGRVGEPIVERQAGPEGDPEHQLVPADPRHLLTSRHC
jgi:hypothetical protein